MTSLLSDKDKTKNWLTVQSDKIKNKSNMFVHVNENSENMLNKQFCPDGVWVCV